MNSGDVSNNLRWSDYVLGRGDTVGTLLAAAAAGGELQLVMGDGFDPRALHTLRCMLDLDLRPRIIAIPLPRGPGHGKSSELVARNRERMRDLVATSDLTVVEVEDIEGADRLTIGSLLARRLVELGSISSTDTVVIDISALPSRIYFPLIGSMLELGRQSGAGELLLTVSENPWLDSKIVADGVADAGTINGFAHGFSADIDPQRITIWAPVIGEGSGPELEAIYELLQQPEEIYPILPFPAREPRRADSLLLEHRQLLFDSFEVVPRNILYVDESNAFDTYRTLTNLHRRSRDLLRYVGDVQLVVSAHASKMLSTGVCLAAWENRLPVVTASSNSFVIDDDPDENRVEDDSSLCCLWLHGTPYR